MIPLKELSKQVWIRWIKFSNLEINVSREKNVKKENVEFVVFYIFRRATQRGPDEVCKREGKCAITPADRKHCTACR